MQAVALVILVNFVRTRMQLLFLENVLLATSAVVVPIQQHLMQAQILVLAQKAITAHWAQANPKIVHVELSPMYSS